MFKIGITDESGRSLSLDVHETSDEGVIVKIVSLNEREFSITSKIRTKVARMAAAMFREFREQMRIYVRAILHNTSTTEYQIRQTIEPYKQKIPLGLSHIESVGEIGKVIAENPERAAKDMLYLLQRAIDLDAQLLGMKIIVNDPIDIKITDNPLNALMRRCLDPFWEQLKSNSVWVGYSTLNGVSIGTDFRLFNCAMYHFLDNIKKYIEPSTELKIECSVELQELTFLMSSRALEEGEQKKIFLESYSGRNAGSQKGEGFGMYIFKEVLAKLNAIPSVSWDDNQLKREFEGNIYQTHNFKIKFPHGTLH